MTLRDTARRTRLTVDAVRWIGTVSAEPSSDEALLVLAQLPSILASLGTSLHQLAAAQTTHTVPSSRRSDPYAVSWDLHRAGDMVTRAADEASRSHRHAMQRLSHLTASPTPAAGRAVDRHDGLSQ